MNVESNAKYERDCLSTCAYSPIHERFSAEDQEIAFFASVEQPFTVLFLLDTSRLDEALHGGFGSLCQWLCRPVAS